MKRISANHTLTLCENSSTCRLCLALAKNHQSPHVGNNLLRVIIIYFTNSCMDDGDLQRCGSSSTCPSFSSCYSTCEAGSGVLFFQSPIRLASDVDQQKELVADFFFGSVRGVGFNSRKWNRARIFFYSLHLFK
jgi:hypothetical protein